VNRELVRRAAAEYFVEGFVHAELRRVLDSTEPELREQARASMAAPRTVPEGCFVWIGYLVWLERLLEITAVPLTAAEAEGLMVLKRERDRFQAEHPPCPKCGMPNEAHALNCRECFAEIPH